MLSMMVGRSPLVQTSDDGGKYKAAGLSLLQQSGALLQGGLTYKSCCSNGDVFKTRFRVSEEGSDQWQYLKDGEWKIIPPDIIEDGDTPDHTPVLFVNRYASSYRKGASDEWELQPLRYLQTAPTTSMG